MNVLMVEPGKAPYETQIGDDLQSMQALVGGYIQAVYPFEQPVALVCCESGKLDGLPLNRALRDADGDIYDIVAGNFFIVGLGESDFTDLPHELAERFAEQFRQPEMFMRVDGKIVAAPKLTANNPTNPYSSHMFPFRFFPKFFYKSSFPAKIKQNRGTARKKKA